MQSHQLDDRISGVVAKVDGLVNDLDTSGRLLKQGKAALEDLKAKKEAKEKERIRCAEAVGVLDEIVKLLSEQGVERLRGLIEMGLNTVFEGREYSVHIELEDKRGAKNLTFLLAQDIDGEEVISDIRDDVGGSVKSITGLIIQIFYIELLGVRRILFADEAFSDIDAVNMEGVYNLLRAFVDQEGFRFLLITHDPRQMEYADFTLQLNKGKVQL